MPNSVPVLYLLCGKIAAGKSTIAASLASRPAAVLISEDHWHSHLFLDELKTIEDYRRCSLRLRNAMGPHVVSLLKAGMSVVLDFPANGVALRKWMRGIIKEAHAAHELHYLDVSDDTCKRRLRERNAAGEHPFQTGEADYELFTSYFVPPAPDEGVDASNNIYVLYNTVANIHEVIFCRRVAPAHGGRHTVCHSARRKMASQPIELKPGARQPIRRSERCGARIGVMKTARAGR